MRARFAFPPHQVGSVAVGLLLGVLAAGCDCSGESPGGSCSTDGDCVATERCAGGTCVARDDAGGAGDDSSVADRDATSGGFDAGTCRDINAESTLEPAAVDIIVVIDNSGSMTEEAIQTRDNMNRFAEIIAESGLDYRVVLISRPGDASNGVCIRPPLGSGLPDCQSGPEGRLLAVHQAVASRNPLDLSLSLYPRYRDFLRPEAVKVFVWITDDEANAFNADSYRAALAALEPAGMFSRTIHNAIVGFYGDTPATWATRSAGTCASLARVGATYLRLAGCYTNANEPIEGCTPGASARVCETVWTSIFEEIARGVVEGVPVPCDFEIPEAPMGMTIDFDGVRLTYEASDGTRTSLVRTPEASCTAMGWHYDVPAAPTRIVLCPDVCRMVQEDEGAKIDIGLGCFPVLE